MTFVNAFSRPNRPIIRFRVTRRTPPTPEWSPTTTYSSISAADEGKDNKMEDQSENKDNKGEDDDDGLGRL